MSNSNASNANQPDEPQPSQLPLLLQKPNPLPSPEAQTLVVSGKHLPASPAFKSSAPNALALLKALRKRWLLAVTLGSLVGAAAATVVWFFLPPGKHMAYAKLYMPKKPEGVLFNHPEDVGEFTAFQQTQVALMKGRMVLNAALRNPKVLELNLQAVTKGVSPVEWLEKEIRITTPEGLELPRITMMGDHPEQLKILLQAVVDAYMQEVVNKQTTHRQERLDQLKEILTKYQERLKRIKNARNELAKAIGSGDNRVNSLTQELTQKQLLLAKAELVKVSADLRRLELEGKTFQRPENGPVVIPEKLIEAYIDKDLEKELALRKQLQAKLDETLHDATEQHPQVQKLLKELQAQKAALEERRKKLHPLVEKELLEKVQNDSQSRLIQVQEQIRFHKEFEKLLRVEISRLNDEGLNLNIRVLDLEGFDADVKLAEAGVARVLGEIDRLTVEMPTPPRVHRMPDDIVVVAPDEVSRKFNMAGMGAAGGFAVVLLLVGLLEIRSRRMGSFDELGQDLGLQLMGTIPAARKRFGSLVIRPTAAQTVQWQSTLVEAINSLRTLVLRAAKSDSLRVLMVTSATSGEGKTSLTTHLAASLARSGYKTLLLDGDLRKPAAHRVFDLPLEPGFSEILRGTVGWEETIRPTLVDGLCLLPAGEYDGEAIDLLTRDGIPKLLEQLKAKFDFIVIDSSPVLPVADALLIAQHVDQVLFSLFHEVSRLPQVYLACQKLNMVGVRILGAVINGTHDETYGYGYRYSYGKKSSNELKS
jgi:polysaccharide biosynthesis transport protein